MQLSIIIVNYQSAELIIQCIQSIYDQTKSIEFEIIVVDNHSQDESVEKIVSKFSAIRLIQMGYNAGFARANNQGIKQSKGDTVLLLNPDTIILNNAIENCYSTFLNSSYVACGIQLLNENGTPQISGNYNMAGALNFLLPLPYIGKFIRKLGYLFKVKKTNLPDANSTIEVDWINGAYIMVKKDFIQKAGLLDEDFFLYAEEAEWCSRIKRLGKLCIFGQYRIIHLQGETTNSNFESQGKGYYNIYDKKGLQILLSNHVRIRKEFGLFWYSFHLLFLSFSLPFIFICLLIHKIFTLNSTGLSWKKFFGLSKNIFKLFYYVKPIISKEKYFYKVF